MMKSKLVRALKLLLIFLLVLLISLVAILQWKSDAIVKKVLDSVENQLADSLLYSDVSVEGLRYFPCIGIRLEDLRLGSGSHPLIDQGDVAIVIGLLPLARDIIDIRSIEVLGAAIYIGYDHSRWSYEIQKPSAGGKPSAWNTMIRKILLKNTRLTYADGKDLSFVLQVADATLRGTLGTNQVDALLDFSGSLHDFRYDSFLLKGPYTLQVKGNYGYDASARRQTFTDWIIREAGIELALGGNTTAYPDHTAVDLDGRWKSADPGDFLKWLPASVDTSWTRYVYSGTSEGTVTIRGNSSGKESPRIVLAGDLNKGGMSHPSGLAILTNMDLTFHYDSEDPSRRSQSSVAIAWKKETMLGSSFRGKVAVVNLADPVYTCSAKGPVPAALLTLFSAPTTTFDAGELVIHDFTLKDYQPRKANFHTLLSTVTLDVTIDGLQGLYLRNPLECHGGHLQTTGDGAFVFEADRLIWKKALAQKIKGNWKEDGAVSSFDIAGEFCAGKINGKGALISNGQSQTIHADWKVTAIDMKALLESFSNFDQSFITSDHLSGKATIWAETTIPMDASWKIRTQDLVVRSAVDMEDGRLVNLKTLEDFSRYIHLEDLKDIRFSRLRNYLKIENSKIYLPVMFIQSSAINLSISGVHGFDKSILYNLKLNAGQAVANKLKKTDVKKEMKPARKSGWINLYFVLEGTTANVQYQQYRLAVLSGFEQSSRLKEELRNYLVDRFGYDVYWLEPNEWEEIPEYK